MSDYLFSIPCAGGSADNYRTWEPHLHIPLIRTEYAGHWTRWEESLLSDIHAITEDLLRQITKNLPQEECGIFIVGHSMGAFFAWLVAQKLIKLPRTQLKGLILCAMTSPKNAKKLLLPPLEEKEDVRKFLITTRNVAHRVLESDLFDSYLYPVIRNDFSVFQTICQSEELFHDLAVPLLVLCGEDDGMLNMPCDGWQNYNAGKNVQIMRFKGDHNFLYNPCFVPAVCSAINHFSDSLQ